jgi:putative chitinase
MGNILPDDGWQYRGRGAIQLTGRANYRRAGEGLGLDLLADPDRVATPEVGCLVAAWFWHDRGLNALADRWDFVTITRRINGGLHGLPDRERYLARATDALLA